MLDLQPIEDELLVEVIHRDRRRRLLLFAAIAAVLGLILAVVWAAGVVSTSPDSSPSAVAPTQIIGAAPSTDTNPLATAIKRGPDTELPMDFTGRWGAIPADTVVPDEDPADYQLFEVDLALTTGNHYVEIGVSNTLTPGDWRVLQIAFVRVASACATADFSSPAATEVLNVDTSDSVAVFSGLTVAAPDQCIGVKAVTPRAADSAGTFIRRAGNTTSAPDPMPAFFAVLQRST